MSDTSDPILRTEGLEVWRGERCLFAGLDLALNPGQLALVLGANGSGKTTLLRVLAGLTMPTAGRATWRGTEVGRIPPDERRDIAYQGHLDGLKKHLTVEENLEFYRALWRRPERVQPLLAELSLAHAAHLKLRFLSAGQRRRVGLGALRLRGARLWLLDEPGTNLDDEGRRMTNEWVRAHLAQGGLAVVATHHAAEWAIPGTMVIEL